MMATAGFFSSPVISLILFIYFVGTSTVQGVLFSQLPKTLNVSTSLKQGQVLKAGVDEFTVSWELKPGLANDADALYKIVRVSLCYAPVSQKDRGWRKTVDDLKKDKTCQFEITTKPYTKSKTTYVYLVKQDVPAATYFVRAYLLDSSETKLGYGQTTNEHKTTSLFQINGISGRHASLDIAAGCFSAFSVISLLFFFVKEKKKGKK